MLDRLKKYNEEFIANNFQGNIFAEDIFCFKNYESKIILSAPHATTTWQNNRERFSDLFTGAIALCLGETSKTSVITREKFVPSKEKILDFVIAKNLSQHFFIDIHGMKNCDIDLCIGTGFMSENDYPVIKKIKELADKHELRIDFNQQHLTGKSGFTGDYQKCFNQPNILQFEWSKDCRDFYNNFEAVSKKTLPFMLDVINGI